MHLILGFGATGASYLRYLRKKNIPTLVMDSRDRPSGLSEFSSVKKENFYLGKFDLSVLDKVKTIFVSPGIEYENEVLVKARRLGVEILTDIEIFLKESKSKKILISGTNGKTTVVSMIGHVLRNIYRDKKIICCGNIGTPVLDTLIEEHSISVVEVSSFHLEHSKSLECEIGVLLNVEQDHLDRHVSFANYKKIKEKILLDCSIGLASKEDLGSMNSISNNLFTFEDLTTPLKKEIDRFFKDKWPYHETVNIKSVLSVVLALESMKKKKELDQLALRKSHLIDISIEALLTFERLQHRYEILGIRHGLTYINDSKSTNISSLLTAVNSTERLYGKKKVVLICGGDSKNQDFSKIEKGALDSLKKILIYGKDKESIINEIGDKADCLLVEDLEDAVNKSRTVSIKGDVVLLSPSCASTDMFLDYKDRGDKFRELSGFS